MVERRQFAIEIKCDCGARGREIFEEDADTDEGPAGDVRHTVSIGVEGPFHLSKDGQVICNNCEAKSCA